MEKVIIAAKADNHVIGKNNSLPWHLPADYKFFLRTIEGHHLISGRKYFESDQAREVFLTDTKGIVVTRKKDYQAQNAQVVHSIEASFQLAEQNGVQKVYILGGGEIYRQTIALADRLIITEIHGEFEGNIFFPEIDKSRWQEVSRSDCKKDAVNPYDYSFVVYELAILSLLN